MNLVLLFSICFFVNVYRVAYHDYTSRLSGPEEELPEEDNSDFAEDHEDVNAGVMAAPYLRESYLDIASRIASALLLLSC